MKKEDYPNRNLRAYIVIDVKSVPSPYTDDTDLVSEEVNLYPLCPFDAHMIVQFTFDCPVFAKYYPYPGLFFGDRIVHNIREHAWQLERITGDKDEDSLECFSLPDPVVLESKKVRPLRGKKYGGC